MELTELYDAEKRPTGRVVPRLSERGPGEYVLIVSVWVRDGAGRLLATLRSPEKLSWPGYWENPGGMALAGESSEAACRRELLEETGLIAPEGGLRLLASVREPERLAFIDPYFLPLSEERPPLRLQPGETADARWLTPPELDALCAQGLVAGPIRAHCELLREKVLAAMAP